VQFYLKFALPLFALIMAMIAVPYGFLVGTGRHGRHRRQPCIGVGYKVWASCSKSSAT